MSTKIYNGYIINKNLNDFFLEIQKVYKTKIEDKRRQLFYEEYIGYSIEILDKNTINKKTKKLLIKDKIFDKNIINYLNTTDSFKNKNFYIHRIMSNVLDFVENKEDNEKNIFNNSRLKLELFFYPISENKTLIYVLCENSLFNILKENIEGIEEYGYWNNSDKPDDCTNKEWKKRKSDWNIALPGIGKLSEGLLYNRHKEFYNYNTFLEKKDIEEINKNYIIDFKKRKNKLVNELIIEQIYGKFVRIHKGKQKYHSFNKFFEKFKLTQQYKNLKIKYEMLTERYLIKNLDYYRIMKTKVNDI